MLRSVATLQLLALSVAVSTASAVGTVAHKTASNNETRTFKIGLLTTWHVGYDFSGYTSASAVSIAIEKVHADPQLNANGRIKLR
jgi:hypothetical protein